MNVRRLDPDGTPEAKATPGPTILLVGRAGASALEQLRKRGGSVVATPLAGLDRSLLARVSPDAIAFSLITSDADATQVLCLLKASGYAGEAIILAPRLPNRAMVVRELASLAPCVTLTLLETPDGPS
jgi:hypothetical protein